MSQNNVMIIAGETSGDAHGAKLLRQLQQRDPEIQCFGMGGKQLQQAGMDVLVDNSELSVVGFVEVIRIFSKIRHAFKVLKQAILTRKPSLLILIDYPGFNLRMAKFAKRHNIKVLYYISPQLWAWRQRRVGIIKQCVDRIAVVLPFEVEFYQQHHVNADYVGHPLLEDLDQLPSQSQARSQLGVSDNSPVIALCPGSRRAELEHHMPLISECAARLRKTYPHSALLVPMAPGLDPSLYEPLIASGAVLRQDAFYPIITASDAAIAASGTATLQIALTTTPLAIIYKGHWLSYQIAKRLVRTRWIGLCNLIMDKAIVQEFIQQDATVDAICSEIDRILTNPEYHDTMVHNLIEMSARLSIQPNQPTVEDIAHQLLQSS